MKRMPKSVVQCPWNYQKDEKHPEYYTSLVALLEAGYDMIPDVGTSNFLSPHEGFEVHRLFWRHEAPFRGTSGDD